MTTVLDVLAAICLIAGSVLAFAAGLGLLRFPDLLARSHAATKPQVLGLLLMLLGLGLRLRDGPAGWMLVLVALFQMVTAPVAAHMVTRAGYRTGKVEPGSLVVDELTDDLAAAADEHESLPDAARGSEAREAERSTGTIEQAERRREGGAASSETRRREE
ncbi:monovalent cation/H(+) antiporter subunit G [Actinotalea sp. M2MS4P-6]|uniref:monovalent cation/H(+) antiporter subunit G n=1 Tax=Actinotalea sp. M2MS4P-6 TaxID=2983762 RepID=UPI0021E3A9DB|nr:monovalent cation/H(+) antiporter subunit G [Actinotalea sp. M2MS4P-6]MCV2392993.1 monovalent cation/H(+) antiporter subunit G [Actinotalea sp. M2MS4P-6]